MPTLPLLTQNVVAAEPPAPPPPALVDVIERLGTVVHTLFALSVTHPTPFTWYLATVDLAPPFLGFAPDTFAPGTFAVGWGGELYQGLIQEHTGVSAAAAIGGVGGAAGVTLTLVNALGTGGPGRRWFDAFATNVPGYAEPYDLQTATLRAWFWWEEAPTEPWPVASGWALQPDSVTVTAAPGEHERVTLSFGPDARRYRTLPRLVNTALRYPHLPATHEGTPRRVWFGRGLRVPCLPVDADGGLFEVGADPAATPMSGVTRLWVVRPDPESDSAEPVAWPARFTVGAESVLAIPGIFGSAAVLTQFAQRFELQGTGAFIAAFRLSLRRANAGIPCVGSITVSIVLERDGLPSETLVDPKATGEVTADIVTGGGFIDYNIFFQANRQALAAFAMADRGLWAVVKYVKASDTAGDMHFEVNEFGTYRHGILATRATETDEDWVVVGQQSRRGIVKQDYTGGGMLQRDAVTGFVYRRPPVIVAGTKAHADYAGVMAFEGIGGPSRVFRRWFIGDKPGGVQTAQLSLFLVDMAAPTGNVEAIEIEDFDTLNVLDWGSVQRGTISTTALTPSTPVGQKFFLDITAQYNQAKVDGRQHFCLMLKAVNEAEPVGNGKWYRIGMTSDEWAGELLLIESAGQDAKMSLLATPVQAVFGRPDELGDRALVVTAGGTTFPPLGADAVIGVTVNGLTDDPLGTYTGTPGALIERGPDILRWCYLSPDGCGMAAHEVDDATTTEARTRLATWFPLRGGLTEIRDVRDYAVRIARSIRAYTYLTQLGAEALYVAPEGGTGKTPVRRVGPHEHGALTLRPSAGATGALYPLSRLEVFYALDHLGILREPWQGHALIAPGETTPADAVRDAQATDAHARYKVRELGGVPTAAEADGYEWVPPDFPGIPTGLRLRNWLWDHARSRPGLVQHVEVQLPRYALIWRLMDEFLLESFHFPSAAARLLPTATAILGVTDPHPDVYQARVARCQVRELPVLLPEAGPDFPVTVVAEILTWETP